MNNNPLDLNTQYVAHPYLKLTHRENEILVQNHFIETALEVSSELGDLFEFFRTPATLADLIANSDLDEDDLEQKVGPLLANFSLVDIRDLPVLKSGLVVQAANPVGMPCLADSIAKVAEPGGYAVVGMPVSVGGGPPTTQYLGPDLIRSFLPFLARQSSQPGRADSGGEQNNSAAKWDVQPKPAVLVDYDMGRKYNVGDFPSIIDLGNVIYKTGEGLEPACRRYQILLERALQCGLRPITLGGDHSLSAPALEVLQAKHGEFGIIHFDAHHDLYPSLDGTLTHANPFAHAARYDGIKRVLQIGLRTIEMMTDDYRLIPDPRFSYVSAYQVQHTPPEQILGSLPDDIPYYLSFDVDCLSPWHAPETGTPVFGGLGYYQALSLITQIAQRFELIGADFVEVAGGKGMNMAANASANLLFRVLLSNTPYEPLTEYRFVNAQSYFGAGNGVNSSDSTAAEVAS